MNSLPSGIAATLSFVTAEWQSTRQLQRLMAKERVTVRAVFNRLQRLRAEKLVQGRRVGREKLWRLI